MSESGKLKPNLNQQSTKLLNLTVLQRFDSSIEEILFTAAHVSLYDFNVDASQWSRKGVEGSLFVVKRNDQPEFQFIVMNRLNTDNLVENLVADFEYELKVPYLLYQNASQDVIGIWFYNSTECEEVADLINRIFQKTYRRQPPETKVYPSTSELQVPEAERFSTVAAGHPELSSVAPPLSTVSKEPALEDVFSAVLCDGINDSRREHSRQPYHSSGVISPSHAPSVVLSSASHPPISLLSPAPVPFLDLSDKSRINHLLKPSSFLPAVSPSPSVMPPISPYLPSPVPSYPSLNLPSRYGTPILQPFPLPPPTPSPSLFSIPNRDKVREALVLLIQDDRFIDMVHQALLRKL